MFRGIFKKLNKNRADEQDKEIVDRLVGEGNSYLSQLQAIDRQILSVQKSTKTTFSFFSPIHNYCRSQYQWYYNWHVKPYATKIHAGVLTLVLLSSLAIGSFSIIGRPNSVKAATTDCTWTNGGATNTWNNAANWSCGNVPNNTNNVIFNGATSNANITIDVAATVGSFTTTGGGSGVGGQATVGNTGGVLHFASNGANVSIDASTGNFSGYAWLDDAGWVAFGTTDNADGPVNENLTTGAVTGKAKILNDGTLIDFNASPYNSNVAVTLATGAFLGYAWSDSLGWLDFSAVTASKAYTGTITANFNVTTDVSQGGSGDFTLGGGTYTANATNISVAGNYARTGGTFTAGTSTITMTATSTGKTFTAGGQTYNNITFNGVGGGWSLIDNLTTSSTGIINLTNGTLHTDGPSDNSGLTHSWAYFDSTNSNIRTLTLGASSITITASNYNGTVWGVNTSTNLTLNAGTSTITFTGASARAGFGLAMNNVVFQGGGTTILYPVTSINNFTFTGTASQTNAIQLATSTPIINNALTIIGNSAINRVLIYSSIIGTPRTITLGASATMASVSNYVDFQDITVTGGATNERDFQTNAKSAGDCGGNTGITFTTAAPQTWSGATGNWSTAGLWTSRIPLPQDNVTIPDPGAASRTLTADMPRLGHDITVTNANATNKPTLALNNQANTIYGSLTLVSSTYMTFSSNTTTALTFAGRANADCYSVGQTFGRGITVSKPTATLTLQDAFISVPPNTNYSSFTVSDSSVLTATANVTITKINVNAGTTLNMGNGNWTFNGISDSLRNFGTVNANNASISIVNTTESSTFTGGTTVYNNIVITPGSGITTFAGAFTFANMTMASAGTKTVKFTKSTTYTMTGNNFLSGSGTGNITINSDDGATAFTLNKTGNGIISSDYLTLDRSTATPANTWYAGTHSTDGTHNSGWTFTNPPVPIAPTIGTPVPQSATSMRWVFTDNANSEDGFKVYDGSNTLKATCVGINFTYCDETGLSVNTLYNDRYVVAYNATGNSAGSATAAGKYTLANTPLGPTVNATSSTSLTVIIAQNGNPGPATTYEINETTTGKFVQADGTLGVGEVYQTYTNWGGAAGKANTGLTAATQYTYQIKPKNGDAVAGSFGPTASQTTLTAAGGSISGSLYSDLGTTKITGAETIKVSINGGAATSGTSYGDFTIGTAAINANDIITVFVSGDAGVKASTVTKVSATGNLTGINLYQSYTTIRHEGSITSITNTDLAIADNLADSDELVTVNGSNKAIFTQGLLVNTNKTFNPGGDTVAASVYVYGTMNGGSYTHTDSGRWLASGTFVPGTSTVDLTGTADIYVVAVGTAPYNFYNLNAAAAGQTTAIVYNPFYVSNTLTLGTGRLYDNGLGASVLLTKGSGTPLVNAGATIDIGSLYYYPKTSGTITMAGGTYNCAIYAYAAAANDIMNLGSAIVVNNGIYITANSSLTGAAFNTQNFGLSATNFYLGGSSPVAVNFGNSTVNLSGQLSVSGSNHNTLDLSASTVNVGSNWVMTNGSGDIAVTSGTSTVNMTQASGTQTLTSNNQSFNNLTHSGAGVLQLATNAINIDGNFLNDTGAGNFDANGLNISIAKNWTINGGAFLAGSTPGAQTVTFDGTAGQTLTGNTTFHNLTINTANSAAGRTVSFATTSIQTIITPGVLTIGGESGKILTLGRSGGTGSDVYSFAIPGNMTSGQYINVANNTVTGGVITPGSWTNVTNGGNNSGWDFDTTALTVDIAASPTDANGTNGYYKTTAPSITLTADDGTGSGVGSISYKWDSGSYATYTTALTPAEGTHTIYYYGTDLAGNTTSGSPVSREYKVDTVLPTVSAAISPVGPNGDNGYYVGTAPVVTLSGADGTSGLSDIEYKWSTEGSYSTYTIPLTVPEGTIDLSYYSTDNAGNSSSGSPSIVTYKVDLIAPTLTGIPTATSPTNNLTANFIWDAAIDSNSGVDSYYVTIGSSAGQNDIRDNEQTTNTNWSETFTETGTYYIRIKAKDAAGNLSGFSGEGSVVGSSIVIDREAPLVTISNLTEGQFVTTNTITLTGTASDQLTGLNKIQLQIDNGALVDATLTGSTWSYEWANYTEGNHIIKAKALDNVGNEAYSATFAIVVDTTSPSIPADFRGFNVSNVPASVFAAYIDFAGSTDATSGLKSYEIYKNGSKLYDVPIAKDSSNQYYTGNIKQPYYLIDSKLSSSKYSYKIRAIDNAGNSSETANLVIDTAGKTIETDSISEAKGNPSSVVTKKKTSGVITWKTVYPATSYVEYGESASYGNKTDIDNSMNQGHSVLLPDLKPATTYHVKVKSHDLYGKDLSSADFTFTTKQAPEDMSIFKIIIDALQNLFKTITAGAADQPVSGANLEALQGFSNNLLLTDISFKEKGYFGNILTFEKNKKIERSTDDKNYATLTPSSDNYYFDKTVVENTMYYYRLDGGNPIVRKPVLGDDSPLAIKNAGVVKESIQTSKDKAQLTVSWSTNRGSTSQVEFGTSGAYGQKTKEDPSLNMGHNIILEDLSPDTTYHFRSSSKDSQGKIAASDDFTFQTPSVQKDKSPIDIIFESFQRIFGAIRSVF